MPERTVLAAAALLTCLMWLPLDRASGVATSRADPPPQAMRQPPGGALRAIVTPAADPLATDAPAVPAITDGALRAPVVPSANITSSRVDGWHELAAADKLSIKFQGQADLTGQYRIGADGSISIPVIGRLRVVAMTPSELEAALAERVTRYTGQKSYVTVEVAAYRSVFVAGFVSRPGDFPWQPGMTVLQGVALAGGLYRHVGDGSSVMLGDEAELTRLRKAVARQKRNLASLARLEAERRDRPAIEMPQRLLDLVGAEEAAEVVEAETSALVSGRAAFEAKKVALARATEMAKRQLAGLSAQSKRLEAQLSTRRDYKAKIDGLQSKGIVSAVRSMDEFARVGELEDRSIGIAVAIARVEGTLAGLERDRVNLEHDRRAGLDQDIIRVGREIAEAAIEIEAARSGYRKLTGHDPSMRMVSAEPARKSVVSYKIVRQTAQGPRPQPADQLSAVRPGDIVVVVVE
jgi:protein involved in polysaccharide export with SLBB domain